MKTLFLVLAITFITAAVASADEFTLRTDPSGTNCHFASGFNPSVYVIERFSAGSTGTRFKVLLPAGSALFAFNTQYVNVGNVGTDISVAYGVCLSGSFVVGNVVAVLTAGTMRVLPADGFQTIIYTNCGFSELPGTSIPSYVDIPNGSCNDPLPTETSTWGSVKALYR